MCILCGEFVMDVHWTDLAPSNDADEMVVGNQQRTRQRTRLHRTELSNKILHYYRLKLEDWNGSKFLLSDPKGNQEIIHDLGTLWSTAEKLIGEPIDPLDPSLLQQLQNENSEKR